MENKKTTKRALVASVLAIVMCVAMLVGSTFAWFTDSASTAVNKIVAGNLKMEVSYKNADNGGFALLSEKTNIFKEDTLWEPGHVEYAVLNVKNVGTLALKYKLGINIVSETGSTNVNGKEFKLSDYINFAVIEGDATETATDRTALLADAGAGQPISAGYTPAETALKAANDTTETELPTEKTVTLVVWMPETVGNDANYAVGAAAPEINLGITVAATQYTHENDSFGSDYDADAPIPVLFNQSNAFNDGVVFQNKGYLQVKNASVILTEDIDLSNTKIRPNISLSNSTLYLDLNGHDLTVSQMSVSTGTATMIISDSLGTGSIRFANSGADGISVTNGTLIMNSGTLYAPEHKSSGSAVNLKWGTFIMNGGKIVADNAGNDGGSTAVSISASYSKRGAKFIMNGGEIEKTVGTYAAIQASGQVTNTTIEINDGSIKSNTVAIYHPQAGSLTVNGGYIEGETAIYAKAGTLTFNGGKMHATAETAADYTYTSSGMYVTGDAVVVEACGYNNGNNPVVTVAGGTFTKTASAAHGFAYYKYGENTATITNTAGIDIYEK